MIPLWPAISMTAKGKAAGRSLRGTPEIRGQDTSGFRVEYPARSLYFIYCSCLGNPPKHEQARCSACPEVRPARQVGGEAESDAPAASATEPPRGR
jgi:hypothetical protein